MTTACSGETTPSRSAAPVAGNDSRAPARATCPAAAAPVVRVCLDSHAPVPDIPDAWATAALSAAATNDSLIACNRLIARSASCTTRA